MTEDTHISELGLSTRSFSGLVAYHIVQPDGSWQHEPLDTIGKLIQKTQYDLLRMPNLGRKSINEIIYVLDQHGFKLKDYKKEIKESHKPKMKDLEMRDYFAVKAMPIVVSIWNDVIKNNPDQDWEHPTIETSDYALIANDCYQIANAMMEARKQ